MVSLVKVTVSGQGQNEAGWSLLQARVGLVSLQNLEHISQNSLDGLCIGGRHDMQVGLPGLVLAETLELVRDKE